MILTYQIELFYISKHKVSQNNIPTDFAAIKLQLEMRQQLLEYGVIKDLGSTVAL